MVLGAGAALNASDLLLWYQQPVGSPVNGTAPPFINEALPIGNGRLGGLIAGGTARERIVLNEDSLWTGDENPSAMTTRWAPTNAWAMCSSICRDMKTSRITGATSTSATRWRTSATSRAA